MKGKGFSEEAVTAVYIAPLLLTMSERPDRSAFLYGPEVGSYCADTDLRCPETVPYQLSASTECSLSSFSAACLSVDSSTVEA